MIKQFLTVLFLLSGIALYAQNPSMNPGAMRARMGGERMNIGRFYGRIIEATGSKGIEAASVQLIQNRFDTTTRKRRDTVIAGMLTDKRGEFLFEGLPVMGAYKLKVTAIGFKTIENTVGFNLKPGTGDMQAALNALDKDLGNIKLEADPKLLEGVTVTASKPLVSMGIDRKVYNVEKNLVAAGGSAEDVMRNIPSVSVDIDGNVTMRNSPPQIFVDGRPTTMTLDQIPADAIESVELITNPSAKYDASGGTAGILNIVLKKNRKAGYNGSVRAGINSRLKPNAGLDLNVKQGKVNVFASGNYRVRKSISEGTTERNTYFDNTSTKLYQLDNSTNNGNFMFGRTGLDYFLNQRNTIGFSVNAVRGKFNFDNVSTINIDTLLTSGTKSGINNRLSDGYRDFRNKGGNIYYKKLFTKPGRELTADLNYSESNSSGQTNVTNRIPESQGGEIIRKYGQLNVSGSRNSGITFQTDFVNPLTETSKLETGLRIMSRSQESDNNISYVNAEGQTTLLPQLSSRFNYTDRVYAGYLTYTNKWKKLGYQLGLRGESSDYKGDVLSTTIANKDTTKHYSNDFPISLFPSAFLTYQLSDNDDLAFNITRRINRPNFFQLFPFTDYSDTLNLSRGNPNLKPEFTASLELSYQKKYGAGNSFIASTYFKRTTNLITRNQLKEVNPVTGKEELIISYINADNSYITGLELIGRNKLNKWWELVTNFNLYQSKINAKQPGIPDQDAITSYFFKINNNIKLHKKLTLQLSGDYTSKTILPPGGSGSGGGGGGRGMMFGGPQTLAQGYIRSKYQIEAALRYDFLKENRANLTLSINDIFRTNVSDTYSYAPGFEQNTWRLRDPQIVNLNFSYRFGKFDTSLFKRKNTKSEGMPSEEF